MRNINVKTYEENGFQYQFYSQELKVQINQKQNVMRMTGNKVTKAVIIHEIAECCSVSDEAVKNWMYGHNGPSDLEQVKLLGEYFSVEYHQFLKSEETNMLEVKTGIGVDQDIEQKKYTKSVIREIYQAILNFHEVCRCDYYHQERLLQEERYDEYRKAYADADANHTELFYNIEDQLKQSMLDIPEAFYNKLNDYIWGTLFDPCDAEVTASDEGIKEMQEDPLVVEDGRLLDEYYRSGYIKELRELFDEYIVK